MAAKPIYPKSPNTRISSSAQGIQRVGQAANGSMGRRPSIESSGSGSWGGLSGTGPGTTLERSGLAEASTPWYRVRWDRGGGTRAASFSISSEGSNTKWVAVIGIGMAQLVDQQTIRALTETVEGKSDRPG